MKRALVGLCPCSAQEGFCEFLQKGSMLVGRVTDVGFVSVNCWLCAHCCLVAAAACAPVHTPLCW